MALSRYDIDFVHSQLGFSVRHLLITRVHGVFTSWTGSFELDDAALEHSKVFVDIDAATVDTRNPQRDGHLRSKDFFDTAAHPRITFASTQVSTDAAGLRLTAEPQRALEGLHRPGAPEVSRRRHHQAHRLRRVVERSLRAPRSGGE